MRILRRPGQRRKATSLIEFALVVPVFLLCFLGILEYARFLFAIQLLNNAAREGARYAVVNTTAVTTTDIQNYVNVYLAGQGATQLVGFSPTNNITVYMADDTTGQNLGGDWRDAAWGDAIGVTISGTYQPMLPGLMSLSSSMTISATCLMPSEAN